MGLADSPLSHRVTFLVGVRRSGTNWLRRIVDAHPDAAVIPSETYLLTHGIAPLVERVQHGLPGSARTGTMYVERQRFLDAVRDLCDSILGSYLETLEHPVRIIGERTPDHVRALDLVRDIYPDAAVVHIIRDGRDVARSLVSQSWGPTDHAEAAHEWMTGITGARAVAPQLERYLEVGYEALLADPARHVPEIYRFLGLDDRPEAIERALSEAGVPYNVDPAATSVTAQKWRGGLEPDQLAAVLRVAGPLLDSLGYDTAATGAEPTGAFAATTRGPAVWARSVAQRVTDRVVDRPEPFQRQVLAAMDVTMSLVDALLDDIAARRFDGLPAHFAADARVRVVGGGVTWDARGAAAVDRLAQELERDPGLQGRQLRGDVHPGVPAFTIVSTWETPDGAQLDRVLIVTSYGGRVDELTWYRFPRLQ